MIHRTESSWQRQSSLSWQEQLQNAICEPRQLLQQLQLDMALLPAAESAARHFPLRVPQAFIERMETGNPDDPLLRQVLPIQKELLAVSGYSTDPVGEQGNPTPGLIQKYQGRALLMINGHCAVNCRYCFRRHFPYQENRLKRSQWEQLIDQLAADDSIDEVIYSGGDPLASSDRQLHWLSEQIAQISHVQRLRIHTRLPVVIPDRINDECLAWMQQQSLQTVVVLHINHPNEINPSLASACQLLRAAGVTLLNQAVLLAGINDTTQTLKALCEKSFAIGVLPYYLHLLDPVSGAAHFDMPLSKAQALHRDLSEQLPGYLVPKLVKEIAGQKSKTPVTALL